MQYSLKQIADALDDLCILSGDKSPVVLKLKEAREITKAALAEMDSLSVQGRGALDTLLGCMMALDAIIGKDGASDG